MMLLTMPMPESLTILLIVGGIMVGLIASTRKEKL